MDQRGGTERAIGETRSTIVRNKRRLDIGNTEEEARRQAENLSNIAVQLLAISKQVGVECIDNLLNNIFENELVMKAIKIHVLLSELSKFVIDETELQILSEDLEKRTEHLCDTI